MTARTWTVLVVTGFALAGCGFKGPLTLPPKPGDVVVRPAPAGAKPAPETPSPPPPDPGDTTRG
jgi:predicted small lipoprotein YifL